MMLHKKKRESLLSWVQSAGGYDVQHLGQLANGKLLSQLVVTLSDKDGSVTGKTDNDPEKTDSVSEKEQHELTKDTVDSSVQEIENNKQEVNGYHDSASDELKSNGIISHELRDAEVENAVSENGVSDNSAVSDEIVVDSRDDDKNVTDGDKRCTLGSFDVAVNGSVTENTSELDCSYNALKVSNSVSHKNSSGVNSEDHADFIIPAEDSAATEVQGHYDIVQKFIENMLELNVQNLVDFSKCMEGEELEVSKLTVLLLSAMVQYSLSTKKDHIMASCYSLSADAQEEIMDCLELFLKDRPSPIERKEFHCRLARCARLRISPRKHANSMSTPNSNKPAKRGRKRKVNNMEEFFEKGFESPIQNLIRSPDIRHRTPNSEARLMDAVRCKDKTIALLTYDLDVEKFNVDDLKKQNEEFCLQMSKLRKEKDKLKKELDEIQTNLENNELAFEKAQKEWKNEVKSYQSQIKDLKEAEKFWKEGYQMEDTPTNKKPECNCSEEIASLKCALQAKDDKIRELQKQNDILAVQVEKLSREKEDLDSKLEENLSSDDKSSYGRPFTQEKCFNISDLSLRNELKDKCEELQNHLNEKEFEYEEKIQKLEELILQKDKVEKEWKARFRKTDKEREDAINSQKKLEIENSNLKGQIEVFKKVLPDITSQLQSSPASNSTPANRRSSRNRNACDSEKIGQLWHNYEDESSNSLGEDTALNSETTQTGFEQDNRESSTSLPSQLSENKSPNKTLGEKSLSNKLLRSHSASNVTTSELGDSIITCKMCSQSDFCEVSPLIQNICKIVRENNILDTDELLELHKYERDFTMAELVKMLTLLTKILKEKRTSSGAVTNCLKRKRQSGNFVSDKNSPEKVKMSTTNDPEQLTKISNVASTSSVQRSQHLGSDPSTSHGAVINNNARDVYKYRQMLKMEKKKVICLQSKLKNLKELRLSTDERLKNLESQLSKAINMRDTYLERCKNITKEYELVKTELEALNKKLPAPVIQTVVKTMPPPLCESCPKLSQKISSYRIAKKDSESLIASLNDTVKGQNSEIESLKEEISNLRKQKNELEDKLSDPNLVSAGVYSPSLKTLRQKFSESRFADVKSVSDGSEEIEHHDASAITNYSFTVPSSDGFAHSSRNQSQLRAFCKAEDEAEMLSQSSIFEIQSDTPGDRLYEINRRNTLCLPHLKSQYPLELNTTPSQHKYFQPPSTPSCSNDSRSIHLAKKRKISKPTSEKFRSSFASLISSSRPSTSGSRIHHFSSPKVKKSFTHSMHKTNTSVARLQFRSSKSSTEK